MIPKQKIKRFKLKGKFSHNKTFGAATTSLSTLNRTPRYIQDQGQSNYCTAFARGVAASYFFGKQKSVEYQTAKEGQVLGSPIFNGADPESADKAGMEYGYLDYELSPVTFQKDGWQIPAEWQSYPPELDTVASKTTAVPFNVYPDYQSIKNALIAGNADNAVVIANGFWFESWNNTNGIVPVPADPPCNRHDYLFIDFKTFPDGVERLIAQLSSGTGYGDGGLLYMDEQAVNTAFKYPSLNGLGCEIFRKGATNYIQTEIPLFHKLIDLLGQLYDMLLRRNL